VEHAAQAVSEAVRYGVEPDAGLLKTAEAVREAAKSLAAAAAGRGKHRAESLVLAKKWAGEAERLRRLTRCDGLGAPPATAGPKLVLDAGDWWQGTPEGSLTKGAAVAEVFNAIGYDAIVVGNHEYDAGADELRALIGKMTMPVLSANTYGADGRLVPWVRPWI